jgi:hypothetical protein
MKDDVIEDQNALLELLEDTEWSVMSIKTMEQQFTRPDGESHLDVSIEVNLTNKYEP